MIMKIGPKTVGYLTGIITGDTNKSEYMTGRSLVYFFNQFGFNDVYDTFFGTRRIFCQEKINSLNNSGRIKELIEKYYSPVEFIEKSDEYEILVKELNKYLYFDDLKLIRKGKNAVLEDINKDTKEDIVILETYKLTLNINNELYNHISEFLKNEDYFHAVEEAYKFVREKLRGLTGSEKATEAFKVEKYEKIFGHKPKDDAEKDFFDGIKYLHMGIQFLRNEKSHSLAKKIDKNEALHYIALGNLAYELISK